MKSICFFSSYFEKNNLPYYLKCYVIELIRHFDKLVLISNKKNLEETDKYFLDNNKIEWLPVDNEGYDFGMWYKAFNHYPVAQYERIGLINDSCILFKNFNHVFKIINESDWDYCGILDSMQVDYHVQSYFIIVNKRAIMPVADYFKKHVLKTEFKDVINTYEVGITQYLLKSNFKIGAVYSYAIDDKNLNPSFFGIKKLIKQGFPLLKKKIIFGNYRNGEIRNLSSAGFDFNPYSYLKLIRSCNPGDLIIDLLILKKDFNRNSVYVKLFFKSVFWRIYYQLRYVASFALKKFTK